jgi:hypothetical protein
MRQTSSVSHYALCITVQLTKSSNLVSTELVEGVRYGEDVLLNEYVSIASAETRMTVPEE